MGTRMACWPVEPTLKLVIPLYCGRKNKVTVVFVSFLLGMDKKEWKEKKKKRKMQEDTCQGVGMAPDNTTTHLY